MDKKELREDAKSYFVPFLLGNNAISHRLSRQIYKRYKINCFILDIKGTPADIFDFSSKTIKLTQTKSASLFAKELIYLANQSRYTLPLLIVCSDKYEMFIENERDWLEQFFVISTSKDALLKSPLNIIPQ